MTYAIDTQWRFRSLREDYEQTTPLVLYWEANLDSISDDYTPDEADAEELFAQWLTALERRSGYSKEFGERWVEIFWTVATPSLVGTFETAPFQELASLRDSETFLSFFTWPKSTESDEPINWLRLPIFDKAWRRDRGDKGGFIQEMTGWKPSALQPVMHVDTLRQASRR